jgi:hypothetical protein
MFARLRVLILLSASAACSSPPAADTADANTTIGFARDVFPMLKQSGCDECHKTTNKLTSHWTLTTPEETYGQWLNQPGFDHCDPTGAAISVPMPSWTRVVVDDPEASLVLKKLRDPWETCGLFYGHMPPPPRGRLPDDRIEARKRMDTRGSGALSAFVRA